MQFKKKAIDFPPTAADWAVKEMLVNTIQRKREKQILGIIITLLLYLLLIFFILILGYYLNKKHEFSAPQGPPSSAPQGHPSSAPQGPPSSPPQGPLLLHYKTHENQQDEHLLQVLDPFIFMYFFF